MRLPRLTTHERILAAVFLVTLPLVNPYIRGDGHGYYAYVRSLAVDGDLDFENEFRRGDPDFVSSSFRKADGHPWPPMITVTGHIRNQWAVGPSLLWAPAFLQAHAAVLAANAWGAGIPADGYSRPYRWSCALATALYAFLGLLLSYRIAARCTSPGAALAATVALWFASSLPMYMYFLPFHGHALASLSVSAFLWYWLASRPVRGLSAWAAWGLLGGIAFEVYHLNGLFLMAALFEWGRRTREAPRGAALAEGSVFAAAGLAASLPHFAAKWILHGSPFDTGRLNRFFWDMPRLWEVGFASDHGLFVWTPVVLAALGGLAWLCRREAFVAGTLLAVFGAFYYTVACYDRWHGVSGFGNRFFISFTPAFILGLAALLHEARSRAPGLARHWGVLCLPLVVLAAWNGGLMFQWGTGMVSRRGPVDFREVARNQVSAVPQRIAAFGLRYLRARDQVVREQEQGTQQ